MVSLLQGDITSPLDVRRAMQGCRQVFHCAGEKLDPAQMAPVNVAGTQTLFEVAAKSNVEFFCHLSSVGTIGLTEQRVVDESTACNPANLYEETKLDAERVVSGGLPNGGVVILRPTNVFGAETLRSWLTTALSARMQRVLKGNESAHLVYVKDVAAAAAFLFARSTGRGVSTYIVSSDEEHGNTFRAVHARLHARVQGAPAPPVVAAPIAIPRLIRRIRTGRTNRGDIVYSSRKLRELGFKFPFGLEKGLDDAVATLRPSLDSPSPPSKSAWLPPSWA